MLEHRVSLIMTYSGNFIVTRHQKVILYLFPSIMRLTILLVAWRCGLKRPYGRRMVTYRPVSSGSLLSKVK
jgi:hypothetical protein